jgi:ankyrin repeat protein
MQNGVSLNFKHSDGRSFLHLAVQKSTKNVIELLLYNRADVNAKDSNEKSVLHYAVGNYESVQKLIDRFLLYHIILIT